MEFHSDELVQKAAKEIDESLRVSPLRYTIQHGEQAAAQEYLAPRVGLEPTTNGLTVRRSTN